MIPLHPISRPLSRPSSRPLLRPSTALALLVALGAAGCGTTTAVGSRVGDAINSIGSIVTPYKVEIVQGNLITKEQTTALQQGMTREQVRFVLGSPLVASTFHADRWDYVFRMERQGVQTQARKMAVFFKGDTLERVEAEAMPGEVEFVASIVSDRKLGAAPSLSASAEQLRAFAQANPAPALPAAVASAPSRTYPPLEGPGR
jgi:outer membrane protein assembly factor BamE